MGKLKNIDRFDASFFGLPEAVANDIDPQSRLLLETTAEAIFDAGVDLSKLRGSNTGVYIGFTTIGTAEGIPQTDDEAVNNAFLMMGTSRAIYANRINFLFDFRGPSNIMDTACASSMSAVYHAMTDIKSGACDQAIVGGVNLCFAPFSNYMMTAIGAVSVTGQSSVFDEKANGYVRAEACVTIFLQRKNQAKRIYATIVNCKANTDGFKKPGLFYPSAEMQSKLMARVCHEVGVNPLSVEYFEAHGTGTHEGDPQEVIAISKTYCNEKRSTPLLIGSVKSVVGHSEGASGLVSIAKVLIAFEKKLIPANINFESPNKLIKDLIPKKIKVITENTPFPGGIVGVNSYGIGGVNVNMLLKSNGKVEDYFESENQNDQLPRLICLCTRNLGSMNNLFEFIENNPDKANKNFLALINNIIHYKPTIGSSGFPCRGYMIIKNNTIGTNDNSNKIEFIKKIKSDFEEKPLVFIFPGFGCQWSAMGKSLMAIDLFSKKVDELSKILLEFNIDLKQILLNNNEMAMKTCTSIFVAITAMQIALVDILKSIDIIPDFVVGHSFGEIACAYADGTLTAREAILCSYWRGNCLENSSVISGAMIAAEMTWEEAIERCKGTRVIAACHNSENSVTLSGPENEILKLKEDFEKENKFVRQVSGVELPFHSPHLKSVEKSMIEKLDHVIKYPKKRSEKWLSTSVSEENLSQKDMEYASPKYFVNNLLSRVYFYEALKKLPDNCVIIEIGPHSLFESIIKKSIGNSIPYISIMKRNDNENNLVRLLGGIGDLYINGLSPKIENLYPRIQFPVPRGTQSISSLIELDHSKSFNIRKFPDYYNHETASNYIYNIKLGPNSRWNFLKDHVIDGTIFFPATGYFMLVWQSLAANKHLDWKKLPVEFKNVRIIRGTTLSEERPVKFVVNIDDLSGQFYIKVGSDVVCSGNVSVPEEQILLMSNYYEKSKETISRLRESDIFYLQQKEIYKTLKAHGYDYGPKFTGVIRSTQDFNRIDIRWTGEWISFSDSMLHVLPYTRGLKSNTMLVPIFFESIRCDPRILYSEIEKEPPSEESDNDIKIFTTFYDKNIDAIYSNCLEIQGIQGMPINRKDTDKGLCLEKYLFIPNDEIIKNEDIELSRYRKDCESSLANILKEFEFEVKKYLDDDDIGFLKKNRNSFNGLKTEIISSESKFSLNNFLKEILNKNEITNEKRSFEELVNLIDKKYNSIRGCDLLNNLFANERQLRTQLDIILENHFSEKYSIIEFNDGSSNCLYSMIKNWLKYSSLFEIPFEYNLIKLDGKTSSDNIKETNFEEILWNKSISEFFENKPFYDIILANCITYEQSYKEFFLNLSNIVKVGGFVLLIVRTALTIPEKFLFRIKNKRLPESGIAEEILKISSKIGFKPISTKSFSSSFTTILLRKTHENYSNHRFILKIQPDNFDWVKDLQSKVKKLDDEKTSQKIWLIGNGPENGIVGFINCLRKEMKADRIRCLFDMDSSLPEDMVDLNKKIDEFSHLDLVFNVWRNGKLGTFRHLTLEKNLMTPFIETENCYLNILKRGDLNSLRWFEIPNEQMLELSNNLREKQISVEVHYATINDKDIDIIYNRCPIDYKLAKHEILIGQEFSGIIENSSQRVMGIKFSGALSTKTVTHEDFLFNVPDGWSLAESATVPLYYFTTYYSLFLRANLRENECVLIRIENFCFSQAVISICLSRKCKTFVSVEDDIQEKILLDKFGNSSGFQLILIQKNTSFKNQILNQTNGRGVDILISCDNEQNFEECMHCLKNGGRYLEFKKHRILDNNMVPSIKFRKNISFHAIDIDYILRYFQYGVKPNPIWEKQIKEVHELFENGLKNREIKPFSYQLYRKLQFREAVKLDTLNSYSNTKNIIEIQEKIEGPLKKLLIKTTARCSFNPLKTYIITGGLGGFGFELSKWIFERGARRIILTSRTGFKNNMQKYFVDRMNEKNGQVDVSNLDITEENQTTDLIEKAEQFGQLGGIFHLATIMKDGFLENQNSEQFQQVNLAKYAGLKNLDNLTRSRKIDLDYFVVFSSISCGRGNPGQSNYGFSNSCVERLCELRRESGLHGMAIQWGPIDDVGVFVESGTNNKDLMLKGLVPQRMPTCFAVLDYVLDSPYAVVSSFTRGEIVSEKIKSHESLLEQLAAYLGVDSKKIADSTTLEDIGVDSLMSLEIQKRLEREIEKSIPLYSIKKITIGQLRAVGKGDKSEFLKILKQ